jgi:hypothetical protein
MIPDVIERLRIHENFIFAVKGRLKIRIPRYSKPNATLPTPDTTIMARTFLAVIFSLAILFFHLSLSRFVLFLPFILGARR